jgi:hypothetical protein
VILVASWLGGHPGAGAVPLAIMVGFGLFLLPAGRGEICPRPAEGGRDQRLARMDLRATVVPGLVLITVLMAAWLVEIARGHSGCP